MPLSRIESEIKPTGGAATLSAHEDQGPAHKTHDSIFHAMQGTDPSNFSGVRHVNSNRAISSAVLVSREPITPNQLGKFNTLASYECRHYSTNVPLLTRRLARAFMQRRVGLQATTCELHEFDPS